MRHDAVGDDVGERVEGWQRRRFRTIGRQRKHVGQGTGSHMDHVGGHVDGVEHADPVARDRYAVNVDYVVNGDGARAEANPNRLRRRRRSALDLMVMHLSHSASFDKDNRETKMKSPAQRVFPSGQRTKSAVMRGLMAATVIGALLAVGVEPVEAANKHKLTIYQHGKPVSSLPCDLVAGLRWRTAALMGGGLDCQRRLQLDDRQDDPMQGRWGQPDQGQPG